MLVQGGLSQELAHSPSYSPASVGLGRVLSLKTTRPLEYYGSHILIAALRLNQNKVVASRYGSILVLYSLIVDFGSRRVT